MSAYNVQHYYSYDEMMALLKEWAAEYPEMMKLSTIGTSYQGREIPLVTLTRGDGRKPAVLLTGNLHSIELIGSCAVLYAIHKLLKEGDADPVLRELLEEKIIYCIPRINVDGAEANLTTPQFFRGSLYPFHPEEDGVVAQDVDGDGVIRKMRIPDPDGDWIKSALDDRIMVRIWPGMERPQNATFYTVLDEGYVRGVVTKPVKQARCPYDIDPNRSFPYDWNKNAMAYTERPGAGDYPLMDRETRALARFVLAHPELTLAVDMHSNMGAYISPIEFCQDHDYDLKDKAIFDYLGAIGTAKSGYISSGIFPPEIKGMACGSFTTWLYFSLGIPAWCQEIGSTRRLYGGVDGAHPLTAIEELQSEEASAAHWQALFQWDEEKNGGRAYHDWHTFEHPQLGTVEIGGWDEKFTIWNLPEAYLKDECERAFGFTLDNFRAAGYVKLCNAAIDGQTVRVELENAGKFPTTKSYKAIPLGAGDVGVITLLGVLNGNETILHREYLPVLDGGERRDIRIPLKNGAAFPAYRIMIESACAGVQTLECKMER